MKPLFRLLLLGAAFSWGCFAAFAATPTLRIYLVGDSTCATKDLAKQNPERGWGQLFEPLFDGSVVVENHATNGRSTRSFRAEGRWATVCEKLRPGDYVFIQFGHNDAKLKDSTRYSSPVQYAENLRSYVREVRERGAVPVLLTPIMRRHFVEGKLADTHGDYPLQMRRVAAEEQVALLDMGAVTFDWLTALGDEASTPYFMHIAPGECPLYPDGKTDDTHLRICGAHAVARMVAAELRRTIPSLGAHLNSPVPDFVVAPDGSGDFLTLSDAVNAIPDFCRDTVRIIIREGIYREKVVIPATKRNVVLEGRGEVRITWDDYASKTGATGVAMGTSGSSTVYFGGDGWRVENLTFENSAGRVGQAVAVQCMGDRILFRNCRFLGNQDTLYLYGQGNRDGETATENTRLCFENCYVEGTTDFIFGAASALFVGCEIHSKADSFITAASTCRGQAQGLAFVGCRLTADAGVRACYLGRPWRDYAQTIFINCRLGAHIRSEGWHDWNKPQAHKTALYAEYGSSGAGAAPDRRVKWSRQLSEKKAAQLRSLFEKRADFR